MPQVIDLRTGNKQRNRQFVLDQINQTIQNKLRQKELARQETRQDTLYEREQTMGDRNLRNKLMQNNFLQAKEGDEGATPFQFASGVEYWKKVEKPFDAEKAIFKQELPGGGYLYGKKGPGGMIEGELKLYTPKGQESTSSLFKLIKEREEFIQKGISPDSKIIEAYDNKISGTDIDIEEMTPDEVDVMGSYFNITGKMPSLGRGKQATKARMKIVKSAAQQALNAQIPGAEGETDKTPAEAALSMLSAQADTKAIQGSMNFLDKQISAMGSFVDNIGMQVNKIEELSKYLKTFDTRALNVPLRALRGRIAGSAEQAKYDMYLTEIESEIGKLASGSSASIAELSVSAQEKWNKIHDKNLSVDDMLSLLKETKNAAFMRLQSVSNQYDKTRKRMGRNNTGAPNPATTPGTDAEAQAQAFLEKEGL